MPLASAVCTANNEAAFNAASDGSACQGLAQRAASGARLLSCSGHPLLAPLAAVWSSKGGKRRLWGGSPYRANMAASTASATAAGAAASPSGRPAAARSSRTRSSAAPRPSRTFSRTSASAALGLPCSDGRARGAASAGRPASPPARGAGACRRRPARAEAMATRRAGTTCTRGAFSGHEAVRSHRPETSCTLLFEEEVTRPSQARPGAATGREAFGGEPLG